MEIENNKDWYYCIARVYVLKKELKELGEKMFMRPRITMYKEDFNKKFDLISCDYRNKYRELTYMEELLENYNSKNKNK